MSQQQQVFQRNSPKRWKQFKWSGRIFLLLLFICGIIVFIGLRRVNKVEIPKLKNKNERYKNALTAKGLYTESKFSESYKDYRAFINTQLLNGTKDKYSDTARFYPTVFDNEIGIRAAFYVAWDAQAYFSLKRNISKMNMVLPEWFFIDPNTDTLVTNIDKRALNIMKSSGVAIVPLLSNNFNGKFRSDLLHNILTNPVKQKKLIDDIEKVLTTNHFKGINVDFEELQERTDEALIAFQEKLYTQLHNKGFLVSQDVSPFNTDYNYDALGKYNDYIFLMAYDQSTSETKPGPICSQQWIRKATDELAKKISVDKIVLCMAAYGYDWPADVGKDGTVTYQEALTTAKESDGVINFDNNTYNLFFNYSDDNDVQHQVHFADAATNFNTLRYATELQLAGTALWRLGSEDSRLWDFYDKPMTKDALKKFDFEDFSRVTTNNDVDYIGEGEVLDVITTPSDGHIKADIDTSEMLITNETYDSLPSMFVVQKWGKPATKKMVLTFDDGPDADYTSRILDTLSKYHVPASFFIVGMEGESNLPLIRRIYREGHELGNHTFTHPNMAKVSQKRAGIEIDLTRLLIECVTGHSTIMFRAPFNADSEPETMEELVPIAYSRTKNYLTIGESIDPEDWQAGEEKDFNADTIFNRVVRYKDNGNIILLHDAGGDRNATVEALPKIIKYFKEQGYTFTTVADLLGKTRDEVMPPIPKDKGYYLVQFNLVLAETGYYLGTIFFWLFITFLVLSFIRLAAITVFAFLQNKKEKAMSTELIQLETYPKVAIIVPAFNEELTAVKSVSKLLQRSYANFEIIFVDDGSNDATYAKMQEAYGNHPLVKIFTKPNGGKAAALNYGIAKTDAQYVVCIDADTQLSPDALVWLMQPFLAQQNENDGQKIGAVAGKVVVGNEVNILTRWQSIEYIFSQNFERKAFAYVNAITVVPGAIGAFDKAVIEEIGGFTTDILAEDCDLTIRILDAGYVVINQPKALAFTEAPETLKQFMKQRFRWTFGVMQTFWKHKKTLFSSSKKNLGWIALPDILLFKYIIPLFTPVADVLMIIGLLTGNAGRIGIYYLYFMIIDLTLALVAFGFEKENPLKLLWLIPQRLVYRWLMMVVLFRSLKKAIKGELQHWGVLKRTGKVKINE